MTAPLHIGRRTTPHHPTTGLRERWNAFKLRYLRGTQNRYFAALHDSLPLDDPDRHHLEAPALEAAFANLAAANPHRVTPTVRDADREQSLLATCDLWFRDIHGPEHRWDPRTITAYNQLMGGIRTVFHPGGEA
ncbi:hypothetical protein STRCI_001334 [Streptomyces cinnabarinus]|uniref:Uncharacterized protein n=1 Tax=Streptomyces cinnabarinus TaxID=67287 RepID=A0ABY7K6U1_9ACTN|nr:hypothetical protein [Streptomyces cinnabarinus]WAZ20233.1 hypothetical protein STRCI_001334 [Streptomyces cinnabarinus]